MAETLIKFIKTLTRDDYPEQHRYRGHCTELGCPESDVECVTDSSVYATAHMTGWFKHHIIETGHRVMITEITPAPIGSEDCRQ